MLLPESRLDFRAPDEDRFPCLRLAAEAAAADGAAPVWLNAANEVAVQAFLDRRIRFPAIAAIIESILAKCQSAAPGDLDAILELDREARAVTRENLPHYAI